MNNVDTFSHKYETASVVGRKLIDNFYKELHSLYKMVAIENPKVLEAACGPGFSTMWISDWVKNGNFYASDVELDLVEEASHKNPGVICTQESIYDLQRKDNEFDLVFALEVLEHLETPEKAVRELHRVTKRYAIISVPNEPLWRALNFSRGKYISSLGNTPGHINHWGQDGFMKLLATKFSILEYKTPTPWQMYLLEK